MRNYKKIFKKKSLKENVYMEEIIETIDWTPLEMEIKKRTKLPVRFELKQGRPEFNQPTYKLQDPKNYAGICGAFSSVLKELYVDSWGRLYLNSKTGEVSGTANFSYSHKDGGSNGLKILDFYYEVDTDKWFFR